MLLLLHDRWIQHHVLSSTSYASTFSKVRNVSMLSPTDKRRTMRSFVNTGHKGWNNIQEKQTLHIGNKYYNDATNYHKV